MKLIIFITCIFYSILRLNAQANPDSKSSPYALPQKITAAGLKALQPATQSWCGTGGLPVIKGKLTLAEVKAIDSLEVLFAGTDEIVSFDLFYAGEHGLMAYECRGKYINSGAKPGMWKLKVGKKIMFENIRVRDKKTGKLYFVPNLTFAIVP